MRIELYEDKAGEWRWRAIAGNERIVATSGEGYANKGDCEYGLAVLAGALRRNPQVVETNSEGGGVNSDLAALMARRS